MINLKEIKDLQKLSSIETQFNAETISANQLAIRRKHHILFGALFAFMGAYTLGDNLILSSCLFFMGVLSVGFFKMSNLFEDKQIQAYLSLEEKNKFTVEENELAEMIAQKNGTNSTQVKEYVTSIRENFKDYLNKDITIFEYNKVKRNNRLKFLEEIKEDSTQRA